MNILKSYRRSLIACSVLPFIIGHSTIVATEIFQEPPRVVVHAKNATFNPFYLSALSYDGANTLGCYWPQLLSGSRSHVLWADLGLFYTPSAGIGYRQLLKSSLFNPLCFWGVYGYLELPNWVLNPYSVTLLELTEPETRSLLEAALGYVRVNIGAELGTPYIKLTFNGYAFPTGYTPSLDDFDIQEELYGYSMRISLPSLSLGPFFAIAKSYLKENEAHQWRVTTALGFRYQLKEKLSVEIKYLTDHSPTAYHLPLNIGFYYNASSAVYRSQSLPVGYTTLPERFIPHYQNAEMRGSFMKEVLYILSASSI